MMILPLTEVCMKEGGFLLLFPAWKGVCCPWWERPSGVPSLKGDRRLAWLAILKISATPKKVLKLLGWIWRVEAKPLPPANVCPSPIHILPMNIIAWNCRGTLRAAFRSHVRELVRSHDPAILIVMETCIEGNRAKAITDDFLFDGAIHTDTIGYAGGLWLLWNEDRMKITQLANTEQEIHVVVKVRSSNLNWL